MSRDNFPRPIIETLAKRVGNHCSNPTCAAPTSGPHTDDAKNINVGVAAHITAASPGGPRYDASLTPIQRKAASNGIWLCQKCAKLIDTDEQRYPVERLHDWKQKAEESALAQLENREVQDDIGSHSIQFAVDHWAIWRERGNLPSDDIIVLNGWAAGDCRYGCSIRLRNNIDWEDQLQNARMEYRERDEVVYTDSYAIQPDEITLPTHKWVTLEVDHGMHRDDEQQHPDIDTIWFSAETIGDNQTLTWKVADINFSNVPQANNAGLA